MKTRGATNEQSLKRMARTMLHIGLAALILAAIPAFAAPAPDFTPYLLALCAFHFANMSKRNTSKT